MPPSSSVKPGHLQSDWSREIASSEQDNTLHHAAGVNLKPLPVHAQTRRQRRSLIPKRPRRMTTAMIPARAWSRRGGWPFFTGPRWR